MNTLRFLVAFLALVSMSASGRAAFLLIPDVTVRGADIVHGSSGPSFKVSGNYVPTDFVSARGVGVVDFDGGRAAVNAAGVVVVSAWLPVGGVFDPLSVPYGGVLIGNTALGYFPLFPADASTGLGSLAPPIDIAVSNRTLGDIFGPGFSGIADGAVLELRINDTDTFNNSGSFRISSIHPVPEPSSIALIMAGAGMLAQGSRPPRRRSKQQATSLQE